MDGRKFNKGTKGNKGGRPKNSKISSEIEKQCKKFMIELLQDEYVKKKALEDVSNLLNEKDSYIYIIKVGDNYKIGITSNIKNRYKTYYSHSAYKSKLIFSKKIKDPNLIEVYLVNEYSDKCTQGDWFNLSDIDVINIVSYISNLDLQ